ncbi:MAG TPA: GGDEF domain-containing protein [Candidatus Competibacteraceae bacterium]|nr:GGDEF domain-containing protein [Candidatus Competibacteraceae bacterium]
MIFATIIGLGILCLFVIVRLSLNTLAPHIERSWEALMAVIAIVCMIALVGVVFARDHRMVDRLIVIVLMVIAILVVEGFRLETGDTVTIGIYCSVMMPLAVSSLAALRFWLAVGVIAFSVVVHAIGVVTMSVFNPPIHLPSILLMVAIGAMGLWGGYREDRDKRRLFLYLTRERLTAGIAQERNAELRTIASRDPLTGVANRRGFEECLASLSENRQRTIALAMVDIDHFKAFNDRWGHPEGDQCLISVALALAGELHGVDDFLARFGGEEFVILIVDDELVDLSSVLDRLLRAVEALAIPSGLAAADASPVVTISIGCAVIEPDDPLSFSAHLKRADRALYQAKTGGRNRWVIAGRCSANCRQG